MRSKARLATTSLAFMFVLVPAPPWTMSTAKSANRSGIKGPSGRGAASVAPGRLEDQAARGVAAGLAAAARQMSSHASTTAWASGWERPPRRQLAWAQAFFTTTRAETKSG